MNKITDEEIMTILQSDLEYVKTIYDEPRILGIFVYGLANYGFAATAQDVTTMAIYLPGYNEMCVNPQPITNTLTINNRKIIIQDFRCCPTMAKTNNHLIEALITKYYYIIPEYEDLYNDYLRKSVNEIAYTNFKSKAEGFATVAFTRATKLKAGQGSYYDGFKLYWDYLFYQKYTKMQRIETCFGEDQLHSQTLWCLLDRPLRTESLDVLLDFFQGEIAELAAEDFQVVQPERINFVAIKIMNIASRANIRARDFLEHLTTSERMCFDFIKARIKNYKGQIRVAAMLKELGLSRQSYNTLMQKMTKDELAQFKSSGRQGTTVIIKNKDVMF